jgi:hypothetical protein
VRWLAPPGTCQSHLTVPHIRRAQQLETAL